MNGELIASIKLLEKERGLDSEIVFTAIEEALVSAYKREFDAKNSEDVRAEVDRETGNMHVYYMKEVVEDVLDPNTEITLAEAQTLSPEFELGDVLEFELPPQNFGRLAAQTAKSVIMQKLAGAEKERIQEEFSSRIGELCTGIVQSRDRREVYVDIGRVEAVLPQREQVKGERYNFNQRMRFYILRVDERRGHPVVAVSRSHPNLVRKLFEQEVPEIADGTVEIAAIARDAGSRTKMAVASRDPDVDPMGACVGQRGMRVQAVMGELGNEKIDIIEWDPVLERYISNALSPAKVIRVDVDEAEEMAVVIVPDHQLSLAIGREGQNVRLAARLTGWRIDIKSESQYQEAIESAFMDKLNAAADDLSTHYPEQADELAEDAPIDLFAQGDSDSTDPIGFNDLETTADDERDMSDPAAAMAAILSAAEATRDFKVGDQVTQPETSTADIPEEIEGP
ncbi:MAG TPA: transcription termination/antitermination protein NusA, partial [Clostridiaceae bacterium]|nr:transcription termination/antitermination protein NusA [Clostridiaceae bacterium]